MSSLKNSIQRRNHRERAQPTERSKWGLLEKPKDYKLRAADHRVKKRKLKTLQQKARDRNEDEFYFGMVNSQSKNGIKVSTRGEHNSGGGGKVLSADTVKLMKTQDTAYLRTVLQQTRRERERAEQDAVSAEVGVKASPDRATVDHKRVLFDAEGEAIRTDRTANMHAFSDEDESEEDLLNGEVENVDDARARILSKKRRKLEALRERERDIAAALEEVEEQRARMNGSIGGVSKDGVKFKVRQRKR